MCPLLQTSTSLIRQANCVFARNDVTALIETEVRSRELFPIQYVYVDSSGPCICGDGLGVDVVSDLRPARLLGDLTHPVDRQHLWVYTIAIEVSVPLSAEPLKL